jgi:hypothetical protein
MWNTILGGLLAIVGGFVATWLQVRYSRKIKMNEAIAEKTVLVNAEAYAYIKEIDSMLRYSTIGEALRRILERESWFFSNRLFLPGKFPDKWLTIRNGLNRLHQLERGSEEDRKQIPNLKHRLEGVAEEAIQEIYAEMGLKRIEVEDLETRT